jgi:hypothetical protein
VAVESTASTGRPSPEDAGGQVEQIGLDEHDPVPVGGQPTPGLGHHGGRGVEGHHPPVRAPVSRSISVTRPVPQPASRTVASPSTSRRARTVLAPPGHGIGDAVVGAGVPVTWGPRFAGPRDSRTPVRPPRWSAARAEALFGHLRAACSCGPCPSTAPWRNEPWLTGPGRAGPVRRPGGGRSGADRRRETSGVVTGACLRSGRRLWPGRRRPSCRRRPRGRGRGRRPRRGPSRPPRTSCPRRPRPTAPHRRGAAGTGRSPAGWGRAATSAEAPTSRTSSAGISDRNRLGMAWLVDPHKVRLQAWVT